jgi:hypothetical protein
MKGSNVAPASQIKGLNQIFESPFSWIVLAFVISRIVFFREGVRFDMSPMLWFWQFADPALLRAHLVQSVFYLHTQPPLFNLFTGLVLKMFTGLEVMIFHLIYIALGLILCLSLFSIMRRLKIGRGLSTLLTILFTISPSCILYENWLLYTYPIATILTLSVFLLHRFVSENGMGYGVLFFAFLSFCALTRSIFHPLWYLMNVLILVRCYKQYARKMIIASAIPMLLLILVFTKNYLVWNDLSSSTWLGMSLFKLATSHLPMSERRNLAASGRLSETSLVSPFKVLSSYPTSLRKVPQTDVPVLDQQVRSTGFNNYNHFAYRQISRDYLRDALFIITKYPKYYFQGLLESWKIYSLSSSDAYFLTGNRTHIQRYDRIFDAVFYGKFSRRDGGTAWFLQFGIIVLIVDSFARILKSKEQIPAERLTWIFLSINVLYMTVVGNALEIGENNRFRFEIDPMFLLLFAGFFRTRIQPFLKRNTTRGIQERAN